MRVASATTAEPAITPSTLTMPTVSTRDVSLKNINHSSVYDTGATKLSASMRPLLVATNASCSVFGASCT